jgi:hypothetical protein
MNYIFGVIDKTSMTTQENNSDRIDKLIAFFRSLKVKKPSCDPPDYSSWNQTEEEYQKQQAEWLEEVRRKKEIKENRHPSCKRKK